MSDQGHLNHAGPDVIWGWALAPDAPDQPADLEFLCHDQIVARFTADQYREDLQNGPRRGCSSFLLHWVNQWNGLRTQQVRVRRVADQHDLPASPVTMTGHTENDAHGRNLLAEIIARAAHTPETLDAMLGLLAARVHDLLQARAALARAPAPMATGFYIRWATLLPPNSLPAPPRRIPTPPPQITRRILAVGDFTSPLQGQAALGRIMALRDLGVHLCVADEQLEEIAGLPPEPAFELCRAPDYLNIEDVLQRQGALLDGVVLHGVDIFQRYGALVRRYCASARVVLSLIGLDSTALAGRAVLEQRADLTARAHRAAMQESVAVMSVDAVMVSSAAEAETLRAYGWPARIEAAPWVQPLCPCPFPFEVRQGVGVLVEDWSSMVLNGLTWLHQTVVPLVRQAAPWIEFHVWIAPMAGQVPATLRAALDPAQGWRVTHQGSAQAFLHSVRLSLVPEHVGLGLRPQLVQSLAAGIACVATPMAVDGLDPPQPVMDFVSDDPARMAEFIITLHENPALNEASARAGMESIGASFSRATMTQAWTGALQMPICSQPLLGQP